MITDGARSNKSSSRNLRESTRFQRLAVSNYILKREMPDELRFSENTPKKFVSETQSKKQIVHVVLKLKL